MEALGGGTGNAAFILKYLFKEKISNSLISRVEDKIGTDFKLFFYKQGFLSNLKSIMDLKKKQKMFFFINSTKYKMLYKKNLLTSTLLF